MKKDEWSTNVPEISGYYFAIPRDRDDWLEGNPEVVYLTVHGGERYVSRPEKANFGRDEIEAIKYWGPMLRHPRMPEEYRGEDEPAGYAADA